MKLKNIIYNLSKLPSYSPPQKTNFKDSDRRQEKCNALTLLASWCWWDMEMLSWKEWTHGSLLCTSTCKNDINWLCFGQTTWEKKGIADPVSRTFSIKIEQKPNSQQCSF